MKFEDLSGQITSALMLATLHAAILADVSSPLGRSLVLAHLGLFLIWQPVWRGDQRLSWINSSIFIALTIVFVLWLDWWLITGWLILLIGITGGRLPQTVRERNTNITILFFLFIELLIGCAAHLFDIRLDTAIINFFNVGLFILPVAILIMPGKRQAVEKFQQQVDLFSAITTALLASLLLLGSIINSYPLTDQNYVTAIIETFLFIGIIILLISWLLSPRAGFSGLAQLWTQSLLNIGTPFEFWISEIASLRNNTDTPEEFIDQATKKLTSLPMIDGVEWHADNLSGMHGSETRYSADIESGDIRVRIMTASSVGATLLLHFKLLIRIIDHFYTAKVQERELSRQAHMRAIYETGARMTHDIKNLLQSFQNITSILGSSAGKSQDTLALLQRQLPTLTRRLESALAKLQAPDQSDIRMVSVQNWWNELEIERSEEAIHYSENIDSDILIPEDLFDTVVNNLIENALKKAHDNEQVTVQVAIECSNNRAVLTVADDGRAIPAEVAVNLFKQPITSASGLGVGLLQAHKLAEDCGYCLELAENRDGVVKFRLYRR